MVMKKLIPDGKCLDAHTHQTAVTLSGHVSIEDTEFVNRHLECNGEDSRGPSLHLTNHLPIRQMENAQSMIVIVPYTHTRLRDFALING